MASDSEEILAALDALHAVQHAHDVDAMIEAYDTDGYVDASRMRGCFQGLVDQDALRSRSVELSCAEIYRFTVDARRHHAFADKAARLASQIDEADWRSACLDSRLVPEPPES